MNVTNLTEILGAGLNNPDCSFFVGATIGQWLTLRIFMAFSSVIITAYFIIRFIDKIIVTPLLNYLHSKIYNKQNDIKRRKLKNT